MTLLKNIQGGIVMVIIAGVAVSWFGNVDSPKPDPNKKKPSIAVSEGKNNRHVEIRFEHKNNKNDMVVTWDFGSGLKQGGTTIDKAVTLFTIDDTVPMGTVVGATAKPKNSKYDPPESMKVQILLDGQKKCPDHFFGNAVTVKCQTTVV